MLHSTEVADCMNCKDNYLNLSRDINMKRQYLKWVDNTRMGCNSLKSDKNDFWEIWYSWQGTNIIITLLI